MGTYTQKTPVEVWPVTELLQAAEDWADVPPIVATYYNEGHLTFHPDKKMIELELRDGNVFEATEKYVVIYNNGFFDVALLEYFEENFEPTKQTVESWSGVGWIGSEEIKHRFGFHKAAIEGENATKEDFAKLRKMFVEFAGRLDRLFPYSLREKEIAFDKLEDASMWFHKTLGRQGELVEEDY